MILCIIIPWSKWSIDHNNIRIIIILFSNMIKLISDHWSKYSLVPFSTMFITIPWSKWSLVHNELAMILILGFLTWFAIWIAGSYYGVRIIKTIRVNNQYISDNNGTCPMSIIVIAFISVILVWMIGIGICISLVVRLVTSSTGGQDGIPSGSDEKGKQIVDWK